VQIVSAVNRQSTELTIPVNASGVNSQRIVVACLQMMSQNKASMTTHEEFIQWLQEQLEEHGWGQAELARRGGITRSQISRLLSGERQPTATTCRAIARAFHMPVDEVFRKAAILPRNRRVPDDFEELQHYFLELSDEDQQRVIVIVRALHEAQDAK